TARCAGARMPVRDSGGASTQPVKRRRHGPWTIRACGGDARSVIGKSEAGADAEADGPRVQLQFAGVAAGHAQLRTGVHVARIGAGEPGRVDVHVHADSADRALGGLDTDMVAGVAEAI